MPMPTPGGSAHALAALARTTGPRAGEALPIARPVATLGRAAACDVVIDDDSVSAQHARLEWAEGRWQVTDLGSVNGTAIDDVRIAAGEPAALAPGAVLRLGGVRFEFRPDDDADAEAARAAHVDEAQPLTLREERRSGRFPLWLVLVVVLLLVLAAYLLMTGLPAGSLGLGDPVSPAAAQAP